MNTKILLRGAQTEKQVDGTKLLVTPVIAVQGLFMGLGYQVNGAGPIVFNRKATSHDPHVLYYALKILEGQREIARHALPDCLGQAQAYLETHRAYVKPDTGEFEGLCKRAQSAGMWLQGVDGHNTQKSILDDSTRNRRRSRQLGSVAVSLLARVWRKPVKRFWNKKPAACEKK